MRLSKMQVLPAALSCLLLFSACDSFFTTSVASWLARDIDYSSLSLDQLLTLAATRGTANSDEAKKILAALANFSEDELLRLSAEQKESILTMSVTAALDLDSVLSAVDSIASGDGDTDDILNSLYSITNSDVDMTAVTTLLNDEETLASASVDTILLASAAVITTVDDDDVSDVISAIENENTDELSDDLADTATTIINVADYLVTERADDIDETSASLGFDLSTLIPGFGSSS